MCTAYSILVNHDNDNTSTVFRVTDANDNSPVFDKAEYVMIFPPTSSAVSLVGRVNARDSDGDGDNSNLKYRLRESSEYFSIASTSGEIIYKKKLLSVIVFIAPWPGWP